MRKNWKKYLCTIAGNVKCSATMQKNTEAAQTLKTEITYDPARPFLGINPEEHTCKSIDRGTDKEDVVFIHNEILLSRKKG